MREIAIITDTASDLSIMDAKTYEVKMLYYQIVYKDRTYKDQVEISSKEVIERLEEEVPTTSLPSLEDIHRTIKGLIHQGYKKAIVITLSSGLSGCYNAVSMVAQEYKKEIDVHVYDSLTISVPQRFLVVEAAKAADRGLKVEEIINMLDKIRANQTTLFIVDTLKYLISGGRIGHVAGTIGTFLNLKPVITIGDDGKYETLAKVRGRNKAVSYFVDIIDKKLADGETYKLYFSHAAGAEIRDQIEQLIHEKRPNVKIYGDTWISPVACVHCGPGYVGMLIQKL